MPQTEEQRQATYKAAGMQPITPSALSSPSPLVLASPSPLPIPSVPQAPAMPGAPVPPPQEDAITRTEQLTARLLGKEQVANQRVQQATLPDQQRLNSINSAIAMHQANSIARQEDILRSGGDTSFQSGEGQRIARTDAIEALKLSAIQQGLQGNIMLAEQTARSAVDAEFAEREQTLQTLRTNIINNYQNFTKDQKKRADAALLKLDKDDAFVASEKEARGQVSSLALKVASFGVDPAIVRKIQGAKDFDEAFVLAAPYMQDPQSRLDLERARLDISLKKEQILTERAQRAQVGQPTATERKAMEAEAKSATGTIKAQKEKIDIIDRLITSKGLNSAVGTTFLGRIGLADKFSGAKQDFLAEADMLISQDFLNTLINVKGQGATFGALTEKEGAAIKTAASKLEAYAKRDPDTGKITGFAISQPKMLEELNRIRTSANTIREAALASVDTTLDAKEDQFITDYWKTPNIFDINSSTQQVGQKWFGDAL